MQNASEQPEIPLVSRINEFLRLESASGILLMIAAALALILSNTPLHNLYQSFLHLPVSIQIGALSIDKSLLHWINDGLMAIFFLLVGLEIKREVMCGELSDISKASLPILGAIGGMIVPIAFYYALNKDNPAGFDGWAIPAATDIAFALGILSLLGTRAPAALKIFLLALAIIDDLGAILIIAFFFTSKLSVLSLILAAAGIGVLFVLNRFKVRRIAAYMLVGVFIWVCVLKSGIHATLAGVVTAFFIPMNCKDSSKSPLQDLEHTLHPWVAFAIMPIFAFANAGISFDGMGMDALSDPITLGIIAGLFLGKQLGVFSFCWVGIKMGLCKLPENVNWAQLYGVAILTGVGFTMSLFIGTLAFEDPSVQNSVKLGVLVGSIAAALVGYGLLAMVGKKAPDIKADAKA